MHWIVENSPVMGDLSNVLLVCIWAAYLQLFYMTYRRRRRPMILINRAKGMGPDAHCLISNMSEEPVYALCIMATVEGGGESWICAITDDEDVAEGQPASPRTHQGPLKSGEFMDVGSFDNMLDRASALKRSLQDRTAQPKAGEFTAIEVTVLAMYASSDKVIGACRRFERTPDHGNLHPTRLETRQLAGRHAQRALKELLRDHL